MVSTKKSRGEGDKTVREQSIRDGEIGVEYTEKPLSGWGGLALMFEFLERNGFMSELEGAIPRKKRSNNTVSEVDSVKTFFAMILAGGTRFAHAQRICGDLVVRTITGAARLGSEDTVRRFFNSLTVSESEEMYWRLQQFTTTRLLKSVTEDVLDLDSTIFERYGAQEGVGSGYHASRHGQTSHHPLLAMFARSKQIPHVWLRAGGASTLRGAVEFVDELLARLPKEFKITAVRADSGFSNVEYFRAFEEKGLDYIIPLRMHPPAKRFAASITREQWQRLDETHEVADVQYKGAWEKERRVLFVRRAIRTDSKGQLFEIPLYEYTALVTTLQQTAAYCVNFYDQRGECENVIKEFKADFGARGFCLKSFVATEAALRLITILFNLVTDFKREILRDTSATLGTVRCKIFVVGAMLGRSARRQILRLGIGKWKERFETLLGRVLSFDPSTAAQLPDSA